MMHARPYEARDGVPPLFDAGRIGLLTWIGLTVAALGWIGLIFAAVVPGGAGVATLRWHLEVGEVAKGLILSGFALALIGTLQTGFGALNRFFNAALDRSAARVSRVAPVAASPSDGPPAAEPPPAKRPYNILADGSVEVETIVGTRRFADMAEARDFI